MQPSGTRAAVSRLARLGLGAAMLALAIAMAGLPGVGLADGNGGAMTGRDEARISR